MMCYGLGLEDHVSWSWFITISHKTWFSQNQKKLVIGHSCCWNFLFSLVLLITMFALVFQFLSPSSHCLFPLPIHSTPSLQITFGKWLPGGRRGNNKLSQLQLLLFLTNHGEHWGGITPRRTDENQCRERPGEFLILETILSPLKFVCHSLFSA